VRKYNPENERIKRKYFAYFKEAKLPEGVIQGNSSPPPLTL
jgi:hypothetical protein